MRSDKYEKGIHSNTQKKNEKKSSQFWQKIKNMKTWKKVVILVAALIVITGLILFKIVYGYFDHAIKSMNELDTPNYDLSLQPVDGYINLLLLGVDSRDMDNIKGTRSDMIMIASINTETNDVTLTSVYRDTYLQLGDTGTYDKITHACVYGGPELTMKSLNQALDIDLQNYAIVNFKAVADIVDSVGGINVDVEEKEIRQLNKYTKQTAKNIGKKKYQLVNAPGAQTLEGVQAVSYGRIRKGVGDDFKRTERMRIVVAKVFEKMKVMSFRELKKIVDITVPQVKTNLSMNDILALGVKLPQYKVKSGSGWPYEWTSGLLNRVSYVFPANLAKNTMEFHREVFGDEEYTTSTTVNSIGGTIVNKVDAARASNSLKGEKSGKSEKTPIKPSEPIKSTKPSKSDEKDNTTGNKGEQGTSKPKPSEKPKPPSKPDNPKDDDKPDDNSNPGKPPSENGGDSATTNPDTGGTGESTDSGGAGSGTGGSTSGEQNP